jgi:hypothetical protein
LDADEVEASSFTKQFEEVFPYYLAVGMTYEQFWLGDPSLAIAYRRADEIRKRRTNEELWLSGVYMAEAIMSTVGNVFSKSKYEYPSEPKPITVAEIEERREREQRAKMERIKAKFTARALAINAQKEVE